LNYFAFWYIVNAFLIKIHKITFFFERSHAMKAFKKMALILFLFFVPLLLQAEFEVKVIKSAEDLPEPFCGIWQKGDYFISDGIHLILVGGTPRPLKNILNQPAANAMGSILSFIPAGKNINSDLNIGSPVLRRNKKTEYLVYSSVKEAKENTPAGSFAFECLAFYEGQDKAKAQVKTTYQFFPGQGKIDVTSILINTGTIEFKDLSFSLYASANHSYSFNPYDKKKHPELNFRAYQKKGHYVGWANLNPVEESEENPLPGKLAPGEVYKLHYILFVNTKSSDLLEQIYQTLNKKPLKATIYFKDFKGKLMEVVVKDLFSSSIFFRSFLEEPLSLEVPLLEGIYSVTANFFPAVQKEYLAVAEGEENTCILQDLPQGAVKAKIQNSLGEFVPGKVTFIGLDPTKTPYFEPDNPVETGKHWETFKNSCYPPKEGLEVKLPVGTYLGYASHGPEYALDKKVIEVLKDETQELIFKIDKVVETPGLISLDPHMHTQNSDGNVAIPERIKSIVAEGVDVVFATDHNYISDYYPTLKKIGLNGYLSVLTADEFTHIDDLIHMNTYPLQYNPQEENNGAIYPIPQEITLFFDAARKKIPEGILQLNHPRSGDLGYFNNFNLDKDSASSASQGFNLSFDVIEAMNGPNFYPSNGETVEDWFHLLNRGYFFPVVGSSDSHSADREEPGYSRTYIFYKGEKSDRLNWPVFLEAIRKGHSFVTNSPLVEFKVNDKYSSGDSFSEKDGKVTISLKVWSAPWVDVGEVRVIVNGERKIIFPVKSAEKTIQKFKEQLSLNLEKDSYILVEVLGKKSLYPVLQQHSWTGLAADAAIPYAITNPVFVDVDGNGKFDPPLPEKIKIETGASN